MRTYSISLCGSDFDTYLYIYEDGCPGSGTESLVCCNDDNGGSCPGGSGGLTSCCNDVTLFAQHTYYIFVVGWSPNSAGYYVLNVSAGIRCETCDPVPSCAAQHTFRCGVNECRDPLRIDAVDADPDLICLRPLTEHRKRKSLLMGSQRAVRQSALKLGGGVCNAFMDAAPGHPLWTGIERYLARASCAHVWHATGPRFLTGDPQPDVAKNSQNATLIPSR